MRNRALYIEKSVCLAILMLTSLSLHILPLYAQEDNSIDDEKSIEKDQIVEGDQKKLLQARQLMIDGTDLLHRNKNDQPK